MFAVTFLTQISWGTIRPLRGTICLAEQFTVSNPWDHCTNHSFAKSHKLTCCLLITQFHIAYYVYRHSVNKR